MQRFDAGDMGCGQLVFELSARMKRLTPGDRLELVARDPGAPTDLPAWCRMTGHRLVSANHPVYVIERKEN
jgi:tRNA 2-thiouridine synthesizing protein A